MCVYDSVYVCVYEFVYDVLHSCRACSQYEVATISRLLKIIGLFCRISSLL